MKKRRLAGLMTHQYKKLPVTMKCGCSFTLCPGLLIYVITSLHISVYSREIRLHVPRYCKSTVVNFISLSCCSDFIVTQVGHYLDGLFSQTSMFVLVAIACDRYMAVCRPLSLQKRTGTPLRQGVIRAAACWLVAALIAAPNILINGMVELTDSLMHGTCTSACNTL